MLKISKKDIDDHLADGQLYSLKTLKTPQLSIYLARVLMITSAIVFVALWMPWQQNIHGNGKLTALNPADRPQTVQSLIPGQIKKWYVAEGQYVNKGDTLLELGETKDKYFDPLIVARMNSQIEAKTAGLVAKELKRDAYSNQIIALKQSLDAKIKQTRNKIAQTKLKIVSDSIALVAEEVAFGNAENIFARNKMLFESRNITLTKYQELESKFNAANAKLIEKENKFLQSKTDLGIVITDLAGIQADYSEKISKATTELQATSAEINETQAAILKMENELSNVKVRRENYFLKSPQNGYVVKALKSGVGENIKEGEGIVTIQPDHPQMAVEILVRAMDVPLLQTGRKARIQFDGWPALQFSGWPNVSVGTFGGILQVIDRVNDNSGLFRILVVPDPADVPWPEQLRLGSGVKGWVMLDNVFIWYEIWRQLNGFPPSLYKEPQKEEKKPKNKIKIK